jgi:hypothetical protein
MLGETVHLLIEPLFVEMLDGVDQFDVQVAAMVAQQAAIGRFLGHCVLKGIFRIGRQAAFEQELGGPQLGQRRLQRFRIQSRHMLQQDKRKFPADHRCRLQQRLRGGWQAIDAGCENSGDRRRQFREGRLCRTQPVIRIPENLEDCNYAGAGSPMSQG